MRMTWSPLHTGTKQKKTVSVQVHTEGFWDVSCCRDTTWTLSLASCRNPAEADDDDDDVFAASQSHLVSI